MSSFERLFPSNVIARAEATYLSRSALPIRRWRMWMNRLVMILVFSFALLYIFTYLYTRAFSASLTLQFRDFLINGHEIIGPLGVIWVIALHFRLMFQTLALSANSISREHGGGTWEVLLLTTIDSGQIVMGKWRAIIARQWRQYLLLGILRGLAVVWIITANFSTYSWGVYNSYTQYGDAYLLSTVVGMLLTMGFMVVVTMLNLAFTAASGLSSSVDHRSSAIALARGFGTRLVVLGAVVLIPLAIAHVLRLYYMMGTLAGVFGTAIGMALVTMVDNGVTLSYQMLTTGFLQRSPFYTEYGIYYMASAFLAMITAPLTYILLTWVILRYTRWRAVRGGALRPQHSVSLTV